MASQSRHDVQKSRVYRCDGATTPFAKGHTLETTADIEAWIARIVNKDYFKRNWPGLANSRIHVKSGAGTRIARGGWGGGVIRINAPLWARTESVMLHEMAHVLQMFTRRHVVTCVGGKLDRDGPWQSHGWQFGFCYLLLVRNELGKAAHDDLKAEFKANKVRYTAPRQGRPLVGAEREAALARLAANREVQAARSAEKRELGKHRAVVCGRLLADYTKLAQEVDTRQASLPDRGWGDPEIRELRNQQNGLESKMDKLVADAPTRSAWAEQFPQFPQPKRQHGMWQFNLWEWVR